MFWGGQDSALLQARWFRVQTPVGTRDFVFSTTNPDQSQGPPSLLYNEYQGLFMGIKWLGCGIDHLLSSNTKVIVVSSGSSAAAVTATPFAVLIIQSRTMQV